MDSSDLKPEMANDVSLLTHEGRPGPRHMKGRQVATALYLAPEMYWDLKTLSKRSSRPIQRILREALSEWMEKHRQADILQ